MRKIDVAAMVMAAAGLACLIVGTVLWFTADELMVVGVMSAEAYEEATSPDRSAPVALWVIGTVLAMFAAVVPRLRR